MTFISRGMGIGLRALEERKAYCSAASSILVSLFLKFLFRVSQDPAGGPVAEDEVLLQVGNPQTLWDEVDDSGIDRSQFTAEFGKRIALLNPAHSMRSPVLPLYRNTYTPFMRLFATL